jgi:hypothetical protein
LVIRSSLPGRPILVGYTSNPVNGINISNADLADIRTTATSTLTFGDDSQTGDITFRTARLATTAGAAIVVTQAPGGPGKVVLDDAGAGAPSTPTAAPSASLPGLVASWPQTLLPACTRSPPPPRSPSTPMGPPAPPPARFTLLARRSRLAPPAAWTW